jgi:hypothetical protein
MGNSPQFSNINMKFQRAVSSSVDNPGQKLKISVWLNFDNGWDEEARKPHPPTPEQQKDIENIHRQMKDLGMELSLQLQDYDSKMNVARATVFCNDLRYDTNYTNNGEVNGFNDL